MQAELTISNTGRLLTISHNNGQLIAEILIHGFFSRAMNPENNYVFRGELDQLAAYEYLNTEVERIEERPFSLTFERSQDKKDNNI